MIITATVLLFSTYSSIHYVYNDPLHGLVHLPEIQPGNSLELKYKTQLFHNVL